MAGTGEMVKTGIASISSNKTLTIPETGLTEFILYSEELFTNSTDSDTVALMIYRNLGEEHIMIYPKNGYSSSVRSATFYQWDGTLNNRVTVSDDGTNTTITLYDSFMAKFNVALRYIGF